VLEEHINRKYVDKQCVHDTADESEKGYNEKDNSLRILNLTKIISF
jgi:hypothetical protein